MRYGIIKMKAQEFANERQEPTYIAKAKKNGHCVILFEEDLIEGEDGSRLCLQHDIIETVYPETPTL